MKIYKPKEFAKKIGVSTRTLTRWDQNGIFKGYRTPTNDKYYTYDQYVEYCLKSGIPIENIEGESDDSDSKDMTVKEE